MNIGESQNKTMQIYVRRGDFVNYLNHYILKGLSPMDLEQELISRIKEYNSLRGTYLMVYFTSINKGVPDAQVTQEDYYIIRDMLADKRMQTSLDVFLETPGGSGEATEEIVGFFHDNFTKISFVISGTAKSAGTIMALGGDEIMMTETGSLGPIDAQVSIGRSVQSAYDYVEWIKGKIAEAAATGVLNPVDAVMIAQITPGELGRVNHALKFAEDLVVKWLPEHKFKNWTETETTKQPVTSEMKIKRANEIASALCDHSRWRTHGRSLKKKELISDIQLKITDIDADMPLANLVYRIHALCRLLCEVTPTYKIFATQDAKIFKNSVPRGLAQLPVNAPPADVIQLEANCPKCGKLHKYYGKFKDDKKADEGMKKQGFLPLTKNGKVQCHCGFELDLQGPINEIEASAGKKILYSIE